MTVPLASVVISSVATVRFGFAYKVISYTLMSVFFNEVKITSQINSPGLLGVQLIVKVFSLDALDF